MSKFNLIITTVFLLLSSFVFVSAQDEDDEVLYVPPPQPAYVFDEYNPNAISVEDEKQKLELFVLQFKDTSYAKGYVYIYRGVSDYKFDYQKRTAEINEFLKILTKDIKINSYDIYARFEGFRYESSIELIIQPPGAGKLLSSPNASLLDVKFYDEASLEKETVQKSGQELLSNLVKRVEPSYPPAARAVRAVGDVGILTTIDETGKVIEAKSFIGHPLLRTACESAVRNWQFKPEKQKAKLVRVIGITVCEFKPIESETF